MPVRQIVGQFNHTYNKIITYSVHHTHKDFEMFFMLSVVS